MIKTLAGALNGALLLATTAAFHTLYATSAHELAVVMYIPSVLLALGAGFIGIGGLEALVAGQARHARLCALLSLFWTALQVGFALVLIRTLLPERWLGAEAAHLWMLSGTVSQAILLVIVARIQSRVRTRRLELE